MNEKTLAERLYPAQATPDAAAIAEPSASQVQAPERGARPAGLEKPVQQVEPEPSLDERLYPEGGTPPADGDYGPMIRETFDALEQEERLAGSQENLAAIAEGKQQVRTALQEMGVGDLAAKELSAAFGSYRREPQTDDALEAAGARTEARLRETWGKNYETNVRFAQSAFQEAVKRMPWLQTEMDNGAGNDAGVIKHFAAIGKKLAKVSKVEKSRNV